VAILPPEQENIVLATIRQKKLKVKGLNWPFQGISGIFAAMPDMPPVALSLSNLGVSYRIFRHPGSVTSLQQAASERGQTIEQVVRSILFRLGEGNFVMVLIPGQQQVSWPALRAYLGQSRLTLANEAEVLAATGYRVGAVSPFGLPGPMRILADESVFAPSELSIGSGERAVAIIMKSADLQKSIKNLEIGQFAKLK
jgi:prolyl-tRNA editing enzyme YbaK/EbsC (Cys-tRNA(Pro) deacylase)